MRNWVRPSAREGSRPVSVVMVGHDKSVGQIAVDKIRSAHEGVVQRSADLARGLDNALHIPNGDARVVYAVEGTPFRRREQVRHSGSSCALVTVMSESLAVDGSTEPR